MKVIRHENKIESFGKPAAQFTDARGIPAGSSHYQELTFREWSWGNTSTSSRENPPVACMDSSTFLNRSAVERVVALAGTPVFVYDERSLRRQAAAALAFPNAYGLTVRYAMKACPNGAVLRLFHGLGLHIDASSGFEVERAIRAGFEPARISLSTQELPADFADLVRRGVAINACSLSQLERFGAALPGGKVGLRINPGLGSGGTTKTNVGGPASSFGIWHEHLDEADAIIARHRLEMVRVHTHIGSGSDPAVWLRAAELSMAHVARYQSATTFNLGGGFKVARMPHEKATDLQVVGAPVKKNFEDFAARTGRRIHLEIEPGTFLLANAGAIISTIQDLTDTGAAGYRFLKLDTGMTEICRPALYGAQHPMTIVPRDAARNAANKRDYIAVGHCCESGDMLTPKSGEPDTLEPRSTAEARIGDWLVIDGAGAYCATMSATNYNSFPQVSEVLLREDGTPGFVRRRQTLEQIVQNEVTPAP
jgi:diaminopimelate decarboxylase